MIQCCTSSNQAMSVLNRPFIAAHYPSSNVQS